MRNGLETRVSGTQGLQLRMEAVSLSLLLVVEFSSAASTVQCEDGGGGWSEGGRGAEGWCCVLGTEAATKRPQPVPQGCV